MYDWMVDKLFDQDFRWAPLGPPSADSYTSCTRISSVVVSIACCCVVVCRHCFGPPQSTKVFRAWCVLLKVFKTCCAWCSSWPQNNYFLGCGWPERTVEFLGQPYLWALQLQNNLKFMVPTPNCFTHISPVAADLGFVRHYSTSVFRILHVTRASNIQSWPVSIMIS
jgi:hypothetical protein